MFFRRVLELKRWTPHAPVHLFISLSCVAWSSWECSAFHFIPFIRTWSLQSVKRGCNLPLRRCNQASQLKAELICVPLHWLTWRGFFFFVCFITTCPWKKCVTFPVCMFLYVCACLVENTLNLFSVTPGEKDRGTNHSLLNQTEIQFSLKRRWLWTRHDANSVTEYPVNSFFFFLFFNRKRLQLLFSPCLLIRRKLSLVSLT